MIYTYWTRAAANVAFNAHRNQADTCGFPYIMHPLHVAEQMDTEDETIVALLHDVVEDGHISLTELSRMGFNDTVVHAVSLLTHYKYMSYKEYLERLKSDPVARKVKLADIEHNMDETRYSACFGLVSEEIILRRRRKYAAAKKFLMEE